MKKKKPKRTRRQFGEQLTASLMVVFDAAYQRNVNGESEQALIIEHDIIAAYNGDAEVIANCHRKAIKSAVAAVEQGIPFLQARSTLETKLHERLEELIENTGEA